MLSSQPQLEYSGSGARYDIPERPYKCNQCEKNFKDLGGMMQHQVGQECIISKRTFLETLTKKYIMLSSTVIGVELH